MSILTSIQATAAAIADTTATTAIAMTDTTALPQGAEAAAPAADLSVWQLCIEGGLVMIPLALLALVAIYVFFERAIAIRRAAHEDKSFMQRIKDYIIDGELESARRLCAQTDTPYARLIDKGISRIGRPMNDVLVAIENIEQHRSGSPRQGTPWLATTAAKRADDRLSWHGNGHGRSVLQPRQRRIVGQHRRARRRHLRGSRHHRG